MCWNCFTKEGCALPSNTEFWLIAFLMLRSLSSALEYIAAKAWSVSTHARILRELIMRESA